jgi:hypothetical protein
MNSEDFFIEQIPAKVMTQNKGGHKTNRNYNTSNEISSEMLHIPRPR